MGLCCCFPSSAQQATTTQENQTFRGTEQDGVSNISMRHTAEACSLSSGAPNAYPAPTEHRLSWSHGPHPPSAASSTLFDPEGQAFAKHYNPLLSGETSHGSQYSSDKTPNAVPFKRIGEASHTNSPPTPEQSSEHDGQTAISQYTAPLSQAMLAPHSLTTLAAAAQPTHLGELGNPPDDEQGLAEVGSGTPQGVDMQRTAGKGVADQGIAGRRSAHRPSRGLKGDAGQSSKQSSLGRQLGDAFKLRNWKLNRHAGPSLPVNGVSSKPGLPLSPRTESAMMVAASKLGFDAGQAEDVEPSAQPTLPLASLSQPAGSDTLSQLAPHAPERHLLGPPSLSGASVTMLQSMTARAASFRAGSMHDVMAPPSPVASIDRFSSMSSWGASSSSPGSCHGSCSSPLRSSTAGQGRSATAQQLSTSSPDTARHMSGVTEEVEEHSDKAQQSSTSSSAMREMHDSSSSWTRSSLAPRAKAAAKQQITAARTHTADAQISQINRLQPVCQQSAVHDAATDRHRSAVECIGQAATAAPHADVAENDCDALRKADASQQLVPPVAAATALPVKTAIAAGASNKPKQTLEEMAAWLDAQLAAAPGRDNGVKPCSRPVAAAAHAAAIAAAQSTITASAQDEVHSRQPVKAVTCNSSPVQSLLAVKKGSLAPTATGVALPPAVAGSRHGLQRQPPSGQSPSLPLGQSPSLPSGCFPSPPASGHSTPGSRIGAQARSRPTGLPLPRKASPAGPMGRVVGKQAASQKSKGSDLSVTEMMQWLDSKLGRPTAAVVKPPAASGGSSPGAGASAPANTDTHSQQNLSGTTSIREAAAAGRAMPSALQHDQDSQHSADADSASSQHATAGGQEESCSVGQQPTVPEVGPTQASQQTSSSDDLAATAVPPHVASASVTQHTKHAASHEQLPATKSVSATADTTTSRVSAAADGEAAATVADDKGAGSSMTAAADAVSKQSCGQSAPPTLVTASTIGVSARPGAVRKPGGDAEGQRCNLPAAAPAQTAAEMLSWLDATLSAKKPLKVAAKGPPKVSPTVPPGSEKAFIKSSNAKTNHLGTQVEAAGMKGAGTTDMLAWLDAKIAAQRAALIN